MKDKVVLITGATSMIGRACAHLFSQNGMKLMLVGRSADKLENLAKDLPTSVQLCVTDICSEEAVQSMIKKTMASFTHIDGVIHNVSIYPWKKIDELTVAEWKKAINTNLTGSFLTMQACYRIMKEQRSGKFIFISSIAGENIGLPYMSPYAASKAGINGLMRTAAIELAPYNVNVNCISPGKIFEAQTLTNEERESKLQSVPLGRFVEPRDIAEMSLFLLSDKAKNITGQNFIIDGGQSILGEDAHIQSV